VNICICVYVYSCPQTKQKHLNVDFTRIAKELLSRIA
jgi:hypothetical protein